MAWWWTCNKPSPDPVIMPYGVAMPQCANWNDSFGHEDLLNCENISVYVQSQFSDGQVCVSLAIPVSVPLWTIALVLHGICWLGISATCFPNIKEIPFGTLSLGMWMEAWLSWFVFFFVRPFTLRDYWNHHAFRPWIISCYIILKFWDIIVFYCVNKTGPKWQMIYIYICIYHDSSVAYHGCWKSNLTICCFFICLQYHQHLTLNENSKYPEFILCQ